MNPIRLDGESLSLSAFADGAGYPIMHRQTFVFGLF